MRRLEHDALAPFLGAAPVGVGFWDASLRFLWVNDVLAAINGVPAADHVGRTIPEVLPALPDDVVGVYREVLQTRRPVTGVVVSGQTPAEPGRERHWSIDVYPIDGEAGPGIGSIVSEITALREAELAAAGLEDALKLETAVLEEVIASVPLGVTLLWGRELRYRIMNAEGRRMLPARGGDLIGKAMADVFPETAVTVSATVAELWESGEPLVLHEYGIPFDDDVLALDGKRFYDVTFTPIRVDGAVGGFLTTYFEVTGVLRERLELERELARERSIADTLQGALLPRRLPDVPHVDIAARYRPAGERFEVGGDFYDVFAGRDGAWLAVVGDVCGKGPRAAARTSMARYALRAQAVHADDPSELLRLLNQAVRRELEAEDDADFVTLALISLRPSATGAELRLATAGHPPPILARPGGPWRLLGSPGVPVGVVDEPRYVEHRERLAPGERLVLYTDGLLDAQAPANAVTSEELAARAAQGGEVEAVADRLLDHVDAGLRPARDDCALLVLGMRGG